MVGVHPCHGHDVAATLFLAGFIVAALSFGARRNVIARPKGLFAAGLVAVGAGLALMSLYAGWFAGQQPYLLESACAAALGESADTPAFG